VRLPARRRPRNDEAARQEAAPSANGIEAMCIVDPDTPKIQPGSDAAWRSRGGELAAWALARLANRLDAWGGYNTAGQVTRRGNLTFDVLARHFQARNAADIIGLHTADANNRSLGGALDIDQHGDDSSRAEVNRFAALHWYNSLVSLGFYPLLTGSNGKGGYHLRLLLAEGIDAGRIFHFLRQLTADHRLIGLDKPPETFPKQEDVRKCVKGLGNWIRLPGRHHKREYWSVVWDGSRWLSGHAAIDFILSLPGDDPRLIPTHNPKAATIRAYLSKVPHGAEGSGRDDRAFTAAAFLVRDMALSDAEALPWLEEWDAGNFPPKGRERLIEIIKNAHAYGRNGYGSGKRVESAGPAPELAVDQVLDALIGRLQEQPAKARALFKTLRDAEGK